MRPQTLLIIVGMTLNVVAEPKPKPHPRPLTPQEKQIREALDKNYYYKGGSVQKELEENAKQIEQAGKPPASAPATSSASTTPGAVRNPVQKAAAKGDLEALTALIEGGADPGEADSQGNTPLHLSAAQGDWKMVEYLLGRGVVNAKPNYRGETPLHLAAKRGALEVGEALIRAGAPLQARDFEGRTPLDLAKKCTQASARELEAALTKASQ